MVAIPFPTGSQPGRHPQESGGRLINCYAEELGNGAGGVAVIRSAPGLKVFGDSGLSGFRGQILIGDRLFAAFEDNLVWFDAQGTVTVVGELQGSDRVFFSRNNRRPIPNAVVVTELGAFEFTDTTITAFSDGDLPQPNSVTFQDGYFFFTTQDGLCFASGLNDITINALDFTSAESNPDGLYRAIAFSQQLYLMGPSSIEVYSNTANEVGFPFSRVTTIPRGLISPYAVTGFEEGFGKGLCWIADDNAVYILNGYQPQRISTPIIDAQIQAVLDKNSLEMSCYVENGHACISVDFPDNSWIYDLSSQVWHERKSYLGQRWRATGNSCSAFGKWLRGDILSGAIMHITESTRREGVDPLVSVIESGESQQFPLSAVIPRVDFDFDKGTGKANGIDPIERAPMCEISWSDDGGEQFGTPLQREIGKQGLTKQRVFVTRTGVSSGNGRRWRLAISDPVYFGFLGGDMTAIPRSR